LYDNNFFKKIMCNFSAPSPPSAPPPPVEREKPAEVSAQARQARETQQTQATRNLGRRSTILTGSRGLQDQANVTGKTLLGQ
jgi:hypothetical protein